MPVESDEARDNHLLYFADSILSIAQAENVRQHMVSPGFLEANHWSTAQLQLHTYHNTSYSQNTEWHATEIFLGTWSTTKSTLMFK